MEAWTAYDLETSRRMPHEEQLAPELDMADGSIRLDRKPDLSAKLTVLPSPCIDR